MPPGEEETERDTGSRSRVLHDLAVGELHAKRRREPRHAAGPAGIHGSGAALTRGLGRSATAGSRGCSQILGSASSTSPRCEARCSAQKPSGSRAGRAATRRRPRGLADRRALRSHQRRPNAVASVMKAQLRCTVDHHDAHGLDLLYQFSTASARASVTRYDGRRSIIRAIGKPTAEYLVDRPRGAIARHWSTIAGGPVSTQVQKLARRETRAIEQVKPGSPDPCRTCIPGPRISVRAFAV
jgi:hypothetical protein